MSDYLPILSLIVSTVGAMAVPLIMYLIRQSASHGAEIGRHSAVLDSHGVRLDAVEADARRRAAHPERCHLPAYAHEHDRHTPVPATRTQ